MTSPSIPIKAGNGKIVRSLVSPEDYECLKSYVWRLNPSGYAQRTVWVSGAGKTAKVYMHRQIAGCPKTLEVDHINRDKLDNRRDNLRLCLRSQNNAASRRKGGKYSKFRGVTYDPSRKGTKKWIAQIGFNNKMRRIGYFYSPEDAARAYDLEAKKLHGDLATLNFPNDS